MGLFFYTQKGSIISTVVLPTTEIIEPHFWLFVNCSGLMKSHNLERTKLVLSIFIFKAMRILNLKFSKFRKPKALRLITLMRLLVASSLAFEQGSSSAIDNHLIFVFQKGLKSSLKDGIYTAKRLLNEIKEMVGLFLLKVKE